MHYLGEEKLKGMERVLCCLSARRRSSGEVCNTGEDQIHQRKHPMRFQWL